MTLRDQLAAKRRRHVTVTVQVSDHTDDAQRAAAARVLLLAAQADPARIGELPDLERAEADAAAALAAHFVPVQFAQLADEDFEALVAAHTGNDGIDQTTLLPALAAACAVDEDLRDEEWWAEQLDPRSPVWGPGERDQLYYRLYTELHYLVPAEAVGKG
ncbi:hypothetical protein N866_07190 [Actinotalea ferrariae CF5-4]|uniref:Uncharacterized protein n=1 Tax=Actinotalea ferrariae CF5-4 TaxID=948458 RepID=A0A021VU43_9CELL|nr:hypothetical protein [Actinotalea ferrariae]EYR64676.1 hypothetical protein N866_07190 [Actinotalea ferrariae CF5-4]